MVNSTSASSKVALVTGAFSGIGLASAIRLAQAGWTVYGAGRNLTKGESLTSQAQAQGISVRLLKLDVTDESSIADAIQHIEHDAGRLDLLVNNAGFSLTGPVTEASNAQIRQQFETNVIAPIATIRAVLPLMQRNHWGRVINMSSVMGKMVVPSYGVYAASKFAIEGLSDTLRLEFKLLGPGFAVVLIEPPFIKTGLDEHAVRTEYSSQEHSLYGDYFATTARQFINKQFEQAPSPEAVARVVVKAANAARPKARYVVSRQGSLILMMRRLLPDRAFDYVITNYSSMRKHLQKTQST